MLTVAHVYAFEVVKFIEGWWFATIGINEFAKLKKGDGGQSSLVSPQALLAYRVAMFLLGLYVSINQLLQRGFVILRFFTVWNWCGLVFYFGFTAAASLRAARAANRAAAKNLPAIEENEEAELQDKVAATLFHIFLPMAIFIDLATWFFLIPMLRANSDPIEVAKWERLLFSFSSYMQHGGNAVMLLGDLALNRIPLLFCWGKGCTMLWSGLFGVWTLIFYNSTGQFIYPFQDITRPNAFRNYYGLLLGGWLVYLIFAGIMKAKEKITRKGATSTRALKNGKVN